MKTRPLLCLRTFEKGHGVEDAPQGFATALAAAVLDRLGQNRYQLVVAQAQQPSDTVAAGKVISTNPPAAANVPKGSTVTVVVSSGKQKVTIPKDIAGTQFNAAAARLAGLGLIVQRQETPDGQPRDTVLNSNPTPGSQVDKGSTVTLIVSSGQAPTTIPPTTVPPQTTTSTPTSSSTTSTTA